jgi:hypothetical protein
MSGQEDKVAASRIQTLRTANIEVVGQLCFTLQHVWIESEDRAYILLQLHMWVSMYSVTEAHRSLVAAAEPKRHAMQCNVHVSLLFVVFGVFHRDCPLGHVLPFRAASCDCGARAFRLIPLGKVAKAPARLE